MKDTSARRASRIPQRVKRNALEGLYGDYSSTELRSYKNHTESFATKDRKKFQKQEKCIYLAAQRTKII